MLKIRQVVEEGTELESVRELFSDYQAELDEDLLFQDFREEMAQPLKKYGSPVGVLVLAYWDNEVAGCIALAGMGVKGIFEMKRLYGFTPIEAYYANPLPDAIYLEKRL